MCRAGAMHLVLEGSSHDTFNDAVMLVALRFRSAINYARSFKKVNLRSEAAVRRNQMCLTMWLEDSHSRMCFCSSYVFFTMCLFNQQLLRVLVILSAFLEIL